jgi:hypothetical protein
MAYQLDLNSDFASATRSALRERLEKGAAVLRDDAGADPAAAVHQARKKSRSRGRRCGSRGLD